MDGKDKVKRTLTTQSSTGTKIYAINANKKITVNSNDNENTALKIVSDSTNSKDGLIKIESNNHVWSGICYSLENNPNCMLWFLRDALNGFSNAAVCVFRLNHHLFPTNHSDINIWSSQIKNGKQTIEWGSANDLIEIFKINGPIDCNEITTTGLQINGDINFTGTLYKNGVEYGNSGGGGSSGSNIFDSVIIGTTVDEDYPLNIFATGLKNNPFINIKVDNSTHSQNGIRLQHINDSSRYVQIMHADSSSWAYLNYFALRFVSSSNLNFFSAKEYGDRVETEIGDSNKTTNLTVNGNLTSRQLQINGDINFTGTLYKNGVEVSTSSGSSSGGSNTFDNVIIGGTVDEGFPLNVKSTALHTNPFVKISADSASHNQTGIRIHHINDSNRWVQLMHADLNSWSWLNLFAFRFYNGTSNKKFFEAIEYSSTIENSMGQSNTNVNLTVYGDVDYTGIITDISDGRFKKNQQIMDYNDCYNKINQLDLKKYDWDMDKLRENDEEATLQRTTNEVGFIAQEVEIIMPDAVKEKEKFNITDFKSVDYNKINLYLFGAVKKLMQENIEMKNKINNLEEKFINYILQ